MTAIRLLLVEVEGTLLTSSGALTKLAKWADEARQRGIRVRTLVRRGAPSAEMVRLASGEHAELVIMGIHGRGGVSRVLLGGVVERVIRTAPCPVLTVRKRE
jgi:nucleotide-binding universal stress UspA family protein